MDEAERKRAAARYAEKMANRGTPLRILPEEFAAALKRLQKARDHGMDDAMIADQLGMNDSTIFKIRDGRTTWMHRRTYESIMRLRPDDPAEKAHDARTKIPDGARRDASGTRRRVQALRVGGFPNKFLAEPLGVTMEAVSEMARRDVRRFVHHTTYLAYKELYEKLAGTDPLDHGVPHRDVSYTLAWARKRGWAPASCWDDDTIDDPDAHPEWTGACGTRHGATIHYRDKILPVCGPCKDTRARYRYERESYELDHAKLSRLVDRHGLTNFEAGRRLGVHEDSVQAWRAGYRQPDLDRLEDIAELFRVHVSELKMEEKSE